MDRLVTFDCFDTVLTRAVGSPAAVGYAVAERLRSAGVLDIDPNQLVARRREAAQLTFRRLGDVYTLGDIAVQLAELLGLERTAARALERIEIETEQELSRAVPAAGEQVERVRASGAQVGFLSDTPLDHVTVEGLLRAQGVMRDGDLLWVSNELGAGKERGTAYFELARRLGGAPRDWSHVGDDPRADVRMARLSGIRPTWERRGRLNRYESLLDGAATASGGFASLLAGSSRRTRLVLEQRRPELPSARVAVLAGVAAPLLVGYLLWCFQQAQRAGCRRVHVQTGADGAVLQLARRLASGCELALDVRAATPEELPAGREPYVLVGSGWRDADSLATARATGGAPDRVPRVECHWGVEQLGAEPAPPGQVVGYLADAPHGTGVGAHRDGTVDLLTRLLGDADEVLDVFCDELVPVLSVLDPFQDVRAPAWAALQALLLQPTAAEARVWADTVGAWPAAERLVGPRHRRALRRAGHRVGPWVAKVRRWGHFAVGRRRAASPQAFR